LVENVEMLMDDIPFEEVKRSKDKGINLNITKIHEIVNE
jgi:hypothetical protein